MLHLQPGGRRFQCVPEHHFPRQESVVPLFCDILGEALRSLLGRLCSGPVGGGGGHLHGRSSRPQNVGQKAVGRRSAPLLFEKPGQQHLASSFIVDTCGKPAFVFKSGVKTIRVCEWMGRWHSIGIPFGSTLAALIVEQSCPACNAGMRDQEVKWSISSVRPSFSSIC